MLPGVWEGVRCLRNLGWSHVREGDRNVWWFQGQQTGKPCASFLRYNLRDRRSLRKAWFHLGCWEVEEYLEESNGYSFMKTLSFHCSLGKLANGGQRDNGSERPWASKRSSSCDTRALGRTTCTSGKANEERRAQARCTLPWQTIIFKKANSLLSWIYKMWKTHFPSCTHFIN